MLDSNPLAQLRDIHLPPPVSAWPPGVGYYVLFALLCIGFFTYIAYRKKSLKLAPKHEALKQLNALKSNYLNQQNTKQTAIAITTLLKQIALVYHPRCDVASLHGKAWLLFLQNNSRNIDFQAAETALLDAPFNPASKADLSALFDAAEQFIKQRSTRCSS